MEIKSPHANERRLQSGFFFRGYREGVGVAGWKGVMRFIHQAAFFVFLYGEDSPLAKHCFPGLSAAIIILNNQFS